MLVYRRVQGFSTVQTVVVWDFWTINRWSKVVRSMSDPSGFFQSDFFGLFFCVRKRPRFPPRFFEVEVYVRRRIMKMQPWDSCDWMFFLNVFLDRCFDPGKPPGNREKSPFSLPIKCWGLAYFISGSELIKAAKKHVEIFSMGEFPVKRESSGEVCWKICASIFIFERIY